MLLRAYTLGIFPMAEHRDDPEVFWVDPKRRGILPLDRFHISRSLARRLRRGDIEITVNTAFDAVVSACADRPETWINAEIFSLYNRLHDTGHAHSQEIWHDGKLIGGVYGVAIGAAFFGESMFSRAADGSKLALAYLIDRLREGGFRLFDTQFVTPHLKSMGGQEISRAAYHLALERALRTPADFLAQRVPPSPAQLLQRNTQTSNLG